MVGDRDKLPNVLTIIAGMLLMVVGARTGLPWMQRCGALLTGAGLLCGLYFACRRGDIHTNWGVYRRKERPLRFWFETLFWLAAIGFFTAGFFIKAEP